MKLYEEKLSGRTIYRGRILTLVEDRVRLQNGEEAGREVVRHGGGVAILALDGQGAAFFVRQYRYPVGEVVLELPAGKLEPGEDPAECAARELEEECGRRAGKLELLGRFYPSPGYLTEVLYVYLAEDLTVTDQHLDPDEFLDVETIELDRALAMCMSGEIKDAKTLLGLFKYARRKGI